MCVLILENYDIKWYFKTNRKAQIPFYYDPVIPSFRVESGQVDGAKGLLTGCPS